MISEIQKLQKKILELSINKQFSTDNIKINYENTFFRCSGGNDIVLPDLNKKLVENFSIEGLNNRVLFMDGILKNAYGEIKGNNNCVLIKNNSNIGKLDFNIYGNDNNITINSKCRIENGKIMINGNGCRIFIGEETTIGDIILFAENKSSIHIGKNCMFAQNIEIWSGDSHSIIDLKSKKRINLPKNIEIQDHVWLCRNVKILKGITIGCNSIIGQSSVCTKSIPKNSVVAGNPAKIVKRNVTWKRELI